MTQIVKVPVNFQQRGGKPNIMSGQNGMVNNNGKEPDFKGQVDFSDQISFQAVVVAASATNLLNFNDSCSLNVSYGINTSVNAQAFVLTNGLTAANLRSYLQTFLPVIEWINYSSVFSTGVADQAQLGNVPQFTTCNLQRQSDSYITPVKANQRNTQQQRDIQTFYPNGEMVLTPMTSIGVATVSDPALNKTVDLTLKIKKWITVQEYYKRSKKNMVSSM